MSVKHKGELLDTRSVGLSGGGRKMLFGLSMSDDIKKKYRDEELTESMRLLKLSKKEFVD